VAPVSHHTLPVRHQKLVEDAMRVVVANGSAVLRTTFARALDDAFEVWADVQDARGAVEVATRLGPDVCLVDLDLPGDALEAVADIAAGAPDTAVVVLADSPSEDALFASLRAGASGYLLKDIDAARLPAVLSRAARGETVLPRGLVAALVRELRARERRPAFAERLTAREAEVLGLLREGLTTAEIADRLFVAPVTVRTHVASILKKLGVPDRRAAVGLAEEADARWPER
jgi:two-component system, NarL family, nitrate/nitrite response regulator NarL